MTGGALVVGTLLPLLVPLASPTPMPVHPTESAGFAYATILGGFFGLGLIVLLWVLLNLKPRRRQPYTGPHD